MSPAWPFILLLVAPTKSSLNIHMLMEGSALRFKMRAVREHLFGSSSNGGLWDTQVHRV